MKKRFVSLCLAGLIMVAPASAVFTDISDSRVSQTAAVLDALGIMQGVGGGSFAPGKALTRAQFCKLAVTAMGVTDVSPYASYTIFPDVKHSHWAAPYINAAVRHPELKEKSIIRGYADGSFGPNKIVSYGEVCTMLLRMLGYKEEDVGPFWPADYIAQAQAIGLTDGVTITDLDAVLLGNRQAECASRICTSNNFAALQGVVNALDMGTADAAGAYKTNSQSFHGIFSFWLLVLLPAGLPRRGKSDMH